MHKHSFSCIIASNGRDTLYTKTLPSLMEQLEPFDEVIVVYDGEFLFDERQSAYQKDGFVFICSGASLGGPYAQSVGYTKAKSDYVVLLDDDDALGTAFVKEMRQTADRVDNSVCLIIPTVVKTWPDLPVPRQVIEPPSGDEDGIRVIESQGTTWSPPTCSGLTLSKSVFQKFPINEKLRGFNDIQIWRAARALGTVSQILHSQGSIVYFTQSHSIKRKTSSFESRKINLQRAAEADLIFSENERQAILYSAIFSDARSRAYGGELFSTLRWLQKTLKEEQISWFDRGIKRCVGSVALIIVAYVWPRTSG